MLPRVLVAETHPQLAELIDKGLRRHHLTPAVVTTSADAVAAATSGAYAVVVLDLDDEQRGTLAVLHEVRAAHHPATSPETGSGGAGLFVGTEPGTVVGEQALQNVLDRAAAYTGVSALGPPFRGVEVHDLRGGWW